MKESISDILFRIASMIEIDNTPTDGQIGDKKMISNENVNIDKTKHRPVEIIRPKEDEKVKSTAMPRIRMPRRRPSFKNKWNEDSKKELMREYMKNYRAEGRDKEVDGPKSTYKKKFKIKGI